jgi:hypothetical protein
MSCASGLRDQLQHHVLVVHQVVEGRVGIDARRGQQLEERAVVAVAGIVVAGAPKDAGPDPRGPRHAAEAVAAFERVGPALLIERLPLADLTRRPREAFDRSRTERARVDDLAADRLDLDAAWSAWRAASGRLSRTTTSPSSGRWSR